MALVALSTLGLLVIDAIPTVIGVAEAIDAQKKQNQQAKERIKFHLTANLTVDGKSPIQAATVVFKDNKVNAHVYTLLTRAPYFTQLSPLIPPDIFYSYLERQLLISTVEQLYLDHPARPVSGFKFNGFYFPYPCEEKHQGLVAMASDDPPALHWIYAHKDSGELRHGSRAETVGHTIGPWNWSENEEWLVLEETPYFFAVEGEDGSWTLYHDKTKTLGQRLAPSKVLEVSLHRELQLGVSSRMVGGDKK